MEKGKRRILSPWKALAGGIVLSLAVYLEWVLLETFLMVQGILPEKTAFPLLAAVCLAATLVGGLRCAAVSPWGRMTGALLCAVVFAGVLTATGLLCWDSVTWNGRGGILLLCILAGGLLAGVSGGTKGRRVKRKRLRK